MGNSHTAHYGRIIPRDLASAREVGSVLQSTSITVTIVFVSGRGYPVVLFHRFVVIRLFRRSYSHCRGNHGFYFALSR